MPPYQLFSLITRLVGGIVCSALTLLVLLQLRHDKKSRMFAVLTAVIATTAINGVVLRLLWVFGGDIYVLLRWLAC